MGRQYHYRFNTEGNSRRRRTTIVIVICLLLPLIIAAALEVNSLIDRGDKNVAVSTSNKSVQSSESQVFKSKYFQFQTDDSWAEIKNETNDNKYVYRSFNGTLIEHDLVIYINAEPSDFSATRVQPVTIIDQGRLKANGPISDHCASALPKEAPKIVTRMQMAGVTFNCRSDGAFYSVIVSDTNGHPNFAMMRTDGSLAQYSMIYRDLTALPDGRKLSEIVTSFQSR